MQTQNYLDEMESDARWMSKDTWAAKHGSVDLGVWYNVQYYMERDRQAWWDDSDKGE